MKQEKELKFYEEVLVLHPDCQDQEQKQVFKSLSDTIKESKGKIYNVDTWGSRPIPNQGKKNISRGLYFHTVFSAKPQDIQEIKRKLKINSQVVYFYHEKLHKNDTPETHLERFKEALVESLSKEQERQARIQKKQQGMPAR